MASISWNAADAPSRPHWLTERRWPAVVVLSGLCGFLFYYGLNAGELYRTEGLRAIVAAEFLRSGDWITPRLYGEPLLTKPPLAYAAMALASWPFGGVTEWTARLPSAVAATVGVLLVYGLFRQHFNRAGGLIAAALLPCSLMWLNQAPSAELDMLELAWVAGAVLCFLRAVECREAAPPHSRPPSLEGRWGSAGEWLWQHAALLCMAGGALTKWTAPAFFYLTAIPLLLWRRRLSLLWSWPHLTAVCVAAVPCVAWATAVGCSIGWAPLFDTVRREALQHLSPLHHARPYPWSEVATFPLLFLASNLPWTAAALLTLHPRFGRLWDERGRRLWQLLHCWVWPNLLFWSLVPGHHFRHGMPLQPGLAGLAAMAVIAWTTGRMRWPLPRLKPAHVFVGFVVAWLAVKTAFVQAYVPRRDEGRWPRAKAEQIAALVPPGETLYLCDLKDEGILFYYGRPARRVASLDDLPGDGRPCYCVLTAAEQRARPASILLRLADEQGDPIVLARLAESRARQGAGVGPLPDGRGS
jgi:4-amino-4-deoxy-L-arabinose transferase-like glycosyltransferase